MQPLVIGFNARSGTAWWLATLLRTLPREALDSYYVGAHGPCEMGMWLAKPWAICVHVDPVASAPRTVRHNAVEEMPLMAESGISAFDWPVQALTSSDRQLYSLKSLL